ncbi:MAG: thioredoxin family protein [Pseudomonadota bacterium]|nr:thioredoxin family protein [Pseudomonadota bacterium]
MRFDARTALAVFVAVVGVTACKDRNAETQYAVATTMPVTAARTAPAEALTFAQAQALAQQRQQPLIVDFHAPWCYSCYYMATHVLTGPQWEGVEARSVVFEVDADSPEGAALKDQHGIKALPSYLVLDAAGQELGRILGEQTREDFYAALDGMFARSGGIDALAQQVVDDSAASLGAARTVLASYHARYDTTGALNWLQALPEVAQAAVNADTTSAAWLARLRFLQAAKAEDQAACLTQGEAVLKLELGCERSYELSRYMDCATKAPDQVIRLKAQRAAAEQLVESRVFGEPRCADERSAILAASELQGAVGDRAAQQTLLERAIDRAAERLDGDLTIDRNLSDNLRVYMDQLAGVTGDYTAIDALMPQLIAAYPDDYVYAFRHGRSLLRRGKAVEALPFLEQAAKLAYGINRLTVAEQRVQALIALDRAADARKVVAEALKANGPWFAAEAAKLKAMLPS